MAANDISPINVEEVVKEITDKGGRAKTYVEDVAKKLGAQFIINQVQDDFGQLDILINHAAVEPHVPLVGYGRVGLASRIGRKSYRRLLDDAIDGTRDA